MLLKGFRSLATTAPRSVLPGFLRGQSIVGGCPASNGGISTRRSVSVFPGVGGRASFARPVAEGGLSPAPPPAPPARAMSGSGGPFRVVVTRNIPEVALKLIRDVPGVEMYVYPHRDKAMPREEIKEELKKGCDGLLCLLTDKIDKEIVDVAGPRLKIVSTMSVGYNHIETAVLKDRQIPLGFTPDCLTETTADLTVALLMATARRFGEAIAAAKDGSWGTWDPLWLCGKDVHSSTVGIVGFGRIGQAVSKRLKAFGCEILYTGPRKKPEAEALGAVFVSEDELFAMSDFVVPMFPLNDATRGFFNMSRFKKMRKDCIFINATRGEVVVQEDLVAALQQGVIGAAGLDVTVPEPLPLDSPLLQLPNCVILPHIGSATVATREKMATMAASNIVACAQGKPVPFLAKL